MEDLRPKDQKQYLNQFKYLKILFVKDFHFETVSFVLTSTLY